MDGDSLDEPATVDERGRSGPPTPRADPTQFVANRYRLIEVLGRGGMGEVYVARDEMMAREVALKRMLDESPSPDSVERFLREARVQGRLDHPAIPPVYELSRDVDGRPFFAMKRLVGTPLSRILDQLAKGDSEAVTRYPVQRLLRAFIEICHAVHLAHERGVVHRDIKPSNVMIGELGEVYLLDWGVAKVVGLRELTSMQDIPAGKTAASARSTLPGVVIGTPGYMAPEQRDAEDVDPRADIYALGCVLFEILAGMPLHPRTSAKPGTDPVEVCPSLRAPDREIPPELDALCVAATQPDRANRLASAEQLASRVQRYLDGNRDLALRREIAGKHLTAARAHLAEGGDFRSSVALTAAERDPRLAMREAGRALALDPTLNDAADLVGRLMLEPPLETPAEVTRAIHSEALEQARKQAVIGMVGYVGYVLMAFVLLAFDIGDARYAWAMLGLATASFGFSALGRTYTDHQPRLFTVVILNAIQIALIARMFSPVLVAPTVASVTLMALVANPLLYSKRKVAASAMALTIAMIGPMLAEHAGWISSTFTVDNGVLTVIAPSLGSGPYSAFGLATFGVIVVALVAVMGRVRARTEDRARRELHLQSWWLRQLIELPAK